jgi:hypothetical protein
MISPYDGVSVAETPWPNQTDLFLTGVHDINVIYTANPSNATPYHAVEILFHFCTESYKVNVVNGTASTNLTAVQLPSNVFSSAGNDSV